MIHLGDAPTHEMSRPEIPGSGRNRFREVARDVREVALTVAALTWIATGATLLVGFARLTWKLW